MVAYLYRMPAGIPGDPSRMADLVVEPGTIAHTGQTGSPTQFGIPVVIDATSKLIRGIVAADTVSAPVPGPYGFLVRSYPTGASQDPLGVSTPIVTQGAACDVMRRGYMTVKCQFGTPAKGVPVYVWKSASAGQHVQGMVEATDPSTDGFAIPNCIFMGPADADGNVEIAFKV